MKFKNKKEFVQFINEQINVQISNDTNDILNGKRNILHTEIDRVNKNKFLSLLNKFGIRYESHIDNYYFIYIK